MSMSKPFLSNVQTLRKNARKHLQSGAVTEGYRGDRKQVLALLNTSLATELVCVLRYRRHYYMASGIHAKSIAAEFLQHAKDEQEHADMIARRIVQLDGEPDFAPKGLAERSQSEYIEGSDLVEMLEEDLVAERLVIDSYREIVQYLGNDDPTTRRLLESILADEEEHAEDLGTLLEELGKKGEPAKKPLASKQKH